jgi:secondary thiamine-phosphate synthase enzyme
MSQVKSLAIAVDRYNQLLSTNFQLEWEKNMVHQEYISLPTKGHGDMHDLTDQISQIIRKSTIQIGLVNVFCIGSTAAIGAIEFEPGLQRDLPELLNKLIPPSRDYGHEQTWHDGNGHSHLQATWLGPSLTVPIEQGKLVLGTWQQIFHLECDVKPRQRKVMVTVYGE